MKPGRLYPLGVIMFGAMILAAQPARADKEKGPHYTVPSWDQKIKCETAKSCPRFVVLSNWDNGAVLDKETGLVWERVPSKQTFEWSKAQLHCNNLDVGHRKGWRLPGIQELASLVDTNHTNPSLPAGAPFKFAKDDYFYWSVSSVNEDPTSKWIVEFHEGKVIYREKTAQINAWCVRGEQGASSQ